MKELNHLNEQIIINDKYVIRVNILHIIRYLKIYAHLLILAVFSGQDCPVKVTPFMLPQIRGRGRIQFSAGNIRFKYIYVKY